VTHLDNFFRVFFFPHPLPLPFDLYTGNIVAHHGDAALRYDGLVDGLLSLCARALSSVNDEFPGLFRTLAFTFSNLVKGL
jgi:hypothetical protein